MKVLALALLLALSFGARGQTLEQSQTAALADLGTTGVGLLLGAAEANPVGILTIPIKFILIDHAETLPDGEKQTLHAAISSVWGGAAVNNLCVIAVIATGGTFAPACIAAGLVAGLVNWQRTENERLFWGACAELRKETPELKCEFRS